MEWTIFFTNKKTFECPNRHLARFHKNVLLFVGNPFYKPNMHLAAPACSMFNSWWFAQNSKESIYSVLSPLCSMDSMHSFGGIMVGHFDSHFACKWHRVVAACPAKKRHTSATCPKDLQRECSVSISKDIKLTYTLDVDQICVNIYM